MLKCRYVRHHHPVPDLKEEEFKLEVESNNGTKLHLSINDLKMMFPKVGHAKYVDSTPSIQCRCMIF